MTPFDPKSPPLSHECLRYIEELDRDYDKDFPSEEDQQMSELFRTITETVFHSRQGFTDCIEAAEMLVQIAPDFVADQLDDLITRRLVGEVPGMVRRIIKLSRLTAQKRPSQATSIYIQEAARAYIYGLTQASVAMSRAALEQALKEQLARQGKGEFIAFQELVDEATKWKILDKVSARAVRDTVKKADDVLHEAPTDEAGALQVLDAVRGLLQQIYSAEGGF